MEQLFSTHTVAQLTHASVRQIGHWARTGLLKPSGAAGRGRGSRRRYTFQDLVALKTIAKLREGGCPLQKVRAAVRHLRDHYPSRADSAALTRLTLLTDGKSVYVGQDARAVMDLVTRQLAWSVPLGLLINQTHAEVAALPHEWVEPVRVAGRRYHLLVANDPEAGGYVVQCRELPGALEQGDTVDEAIANGRGAIESVLRFQRQRRGRLVKAG